ncbi:hypothetical protein B0J12DRAFT_695328 [Macrophomina phaseolina]|uniref:Uncharacterized protein n=1 Tax=Macrophomina phaseolina TaxID=35725 RepID=A0ABQ8GR37_9PEZI|nr:hypothetical protein B0J12DRAFT_695328 [Macrophomina phaseolina]
MRQNLLRSGEADRTLGHVLHMTGLLSLRSGENGNGLAAARSDHKFIGFRIHGFWRSEAVTNMELNPTATRAGNYCSSHRSFEDRHTTYKNRSNTTNTRRFLIFRFSAYLQPGGLGTLHPSSLKNHKAPNNLAMRLFTGNHDPCAYKRPQQSSLSANLEGPAARRWQYAWNHVFWPNTYEAASKTPTSLMMEASEDLSSETQAEARLFLCFRPILDENTSSASASIGGFRPRSPSRAPVRERTAAESERRVLRRQEIQEIEMEEYVGIAMGA